MQVTLSPVFCFTIVQADHLGTYCRGLTSASYGAEALYVAWVTTACTSVNSRACCRNEKPTGHIRQHFCVEIVVALPLNYL